MKVCYIDVETTGLNAWKNDIIQIAGIIEINGVVMESFVLNCKPCNPENISQGALDVNNITRGEIMSYPSPKDTFREVEKILNKYVDRFDKKDKFIFAGYNANFDLDFVKAWFKKCENNYFGSYFEYKVFDVYPLFFMFVKASGVELPNHRLETAANYFNIPLQAHDAMEDINATKILADKLMGYLKAGIDELDGGC